MASSSGVSAGRRRVATWLRTSVFGCAMLFGASAARADYKLAAGDMLTFTVAGLPELASKTAVDIDGNATFPIVGAMPVAGLSTSQALSKIQAVLPGKEFRRHTDDGREFPIIIAPSDIGLTIFEYRPVYLNGDVAKPGEEPFRPGLTVRKAIALAGGFDILRFKMDNPFLQLSDLTSEYHRLWVDYAQQQALVARLQAELDGKGQIDSNAVMSTPIAPSLAKELLDNPKIAARLRALRANSQSATRTSPRNRCTSKRLPRRRPKEPNCSTTNKARSKKV